MVHRNHYLRRLVSLLLGTTFVLGLAYAESRRVVTPAQSASLAVPTFQADPFWPKPLPNNWRLGMGTGVAVDARDHVWLLRRPLSGRAADLAAGRTVAPPVVEFDPEGNVVQAWGGPGAGYDWPEDHPTAEYPRAGPAEHGIYVDHNDNVWIAGFGDVVLKFTRSGKFLMQIGQLYKTGGSNDTRLLGAPTAMVVDPMTNEVFIADGYSNRRVVVFNADTGEYKRHWGAYGKKPDDDPAVNYEPDKPLPQQFFVVHGIDQAKDGLLYVCDRQRNRLQVFRRDGTFVSEIVIDKDRPAGAGITSRGKISAGVLRAGQGSTFGVALSQDPMQQYLYVADNSKIWILRRSDYQILGSFEGSGQHLATDSKGNLYTSDGRKFVFKGMSPTTAR